MRKSKDEIVEFDPQRVRPLPDQPRKRFKGIAELAASIAEVGQMAPGLVTMIDGVGPYDAQLVDGERRLRACRIAGVVFRAIVRPASSDDESFVASFAANFGKQDHDVIEIAEGLDRMQRAGKSVAQLAKITGMTGTWVYQHLSLLKLHPSVRAMMVSDADGDDADAAGPRLTFQLAMLLVPLVEADQVRLAKRITQGDGMSVAAARRMILKFRSEAGDEGAYLGRNSGSGRRRSILSIETFLEAITDRIGVYLDMPEPDFKQVVDTIDNAAKRQLAESIKDVAQNLIDLAEAIDERRVASSPKRCATAT